MYSDTSPYDVSECSLDFGNYLNDFERHMLSRISWVCASKNVLNTLRGNILEIIKNWLFNSVQKLLNCDFCSSLHETKSLQRKSFYSSNSNFVKKSQFFYWKQRTDFGVGPRLRPDRATNIRRTKRNEKRINRKRKRQTYLAKMKKTPLTCD